jgi:putative flippase GtrA
MTYFSNVARETERWLLKMPKGLVRFISVGFGGLMVDQSVLAVSEHFGMAFVWARALAIFVATCFTWALNRRFTFGDSGRSAHHEALRYFGVAFGAQSVNYAVSLVIAAYLPHVPHNLAAFFGAVVATLFSYTGQRFFTFAPAPRRAGEAAPTQPDTHLD